MDPNAWPMRNTSAPSPERYAAVMLAPGTAWRWGNMCQGREDTVTSDADDAAAAQAALRDPARIGYDEVRRNLGL